ncbi:MAG: ferredoxin [bacterium]|nr:ferredoxin [bacterium]
MSPTPHHFEVIESECIGCGLCLERAPGNFQIPAGVTAARVFKQPGTSAEEQACFEACDYCPMGALQAAAADSPPAGPSAPHLTSIPVGDSTPVGSSSMRTEN